jgi:hypothetical protein
MYSLELYISELWPSSLSKRAYLKEFNYMHRSNRRRFILKFEQTLVDLIKQVDE